MLFIAKAQVGIGTESPHSSAQLEVFSTARGFLPPVMNQTQRDAISTPAEGLLVYCSNCSPSGYYGYNSSAWVSIMNTDTDTDNQTLSIVGDNLTLSSGNSVDLASYLTSSGPKLVKTSVGSLNYHTNLGNMTAIVSGADKNTAIGYEVLKDLTSGDNNAGVGL